MGIFLVFISDSKLIRFIVSTVIELVNCELLFEITVILILYVICFVLRLIFRKISLFTMCKGRKMTDKQNKICQVSPSQLTNEDIILDIRTHQQHSKAFLKYPHWFVEGAKLNPQEFLYMYRINKSRPMYILSDDLCEAHKVIRAFQSLG